MSYLSSENLAKPRTDTGYSAAYLWWLIHREKLNGRQILTRTFEMQDWLSDNVRDKGSPYCNNYNWASISTNIDGLLFANYLWFRHEVDLLAFRLRWGIGEPRYDVL